MNHLPEPEQLGLPLDGLDVELETPESVAGKIANSIFRPWYKEYYEGRYTQSVGHITKSLKQFVLDLVVNGDETEETVRAALNHLGASQQVVTAPALQYALGLVKRRADARKHAGAFEDMVADEVFSDFLMNSHEVDYGKSGMEF